MQMDGFGIHEKIDTLCMNIYVVHTYITSQNAGWHLVRSLCLSIWPWQTRDQLDFPVKALLQHLVALQAKHNAMAQAQIPLHISKRCSIIRYSKFPLLCFALPHWCMDIVILLQMDFVKIA